MRLILIPRLGDRRAFAPRLEGRRAGQATLASALAAAVVGCGATPPQAPFAMAKRLDSATSGISTACGEAYQVTAFPGNHAHDLAPLQATAAIGARKLALVDAGNPDWIYQGQTIAEIVHNSVVYLRACGLSPAAAPLLRAAAGH